MLEQTNEDEYWNHMPYLVMYSMLSYMADNQTMSDLIIKNYNAKLVRTKHLYDSFSPIRRLEYDSYYLIICLMSNIKNHAGLVKLNSYIEIANENLRIVQNEELGKEEIDISVGLKIAAFGNIIYLTTILKEYLFSGKINNVENQDIYSVVDMYSYNAFHLLANENISLKLIGHFLKYSYERVLENSIWAIAEKSPMIKEFIEDNLLNGDRYIYSLLPSQRDTISEVLTPKKSIFLKQRI